MLMVTPVISNRSALQTKQKITSVSSIYAHGGATVYAHVGATVYAHVGATVKTLFIVHQNAKPPQCAFEARGACSRGP